MKEGNKFDNFQFPLWDTKLAQELTKGLITDFQFPLWDTQLQEQEKR